MPATDKQSFINSLSNFLVRANMVNASKAYYSFYPVAGQTNYEFLFNDLLPTGMAFLGGVASATVSLAGNGYASGEIPSVSFISLDAGTGASGTAVMTLFNSTNNANLLDNNNIQGFYPFESVAPLFSGVPSFIPSGDFSSYQYWGQTNNLPVQTPSPYDGYQISGGELLVQKTGLSTASTGITFYPALSGYLTGVVSYPAAKFRWYFMQLEVTKPHSALTTGYTVAPSMSLNLSLPSPMYISGAGYAPANGVYTAYSDESYGDMLVNTNGQTLILKAPASRTAAIYSGTPQNVFFNNAILLYLGAPNTDFYGPYTPSGAGTSFIPAPAVTPYTFTCPVNVFSSGIQKFGIFNTGNQFSNPTVKLSLTFTPSYINSTTSGDSFRVDRITGWNDYQTQAIPPTGEPHYNEAFFESTVDPGNLIFSPNTNGELLRLANGRTGGFALSTNIPATNTLATATAPFSGVDFSKEMSVAFWYNLTQLGNANEIILGFADSYLTLNPAGPYTNPIAALTFTTKHLNGARTITDSVSTTASINTGQWYYITARRSEVQHQMYLSVSGMNGGVIQTYQTPMTYGSNITNFSNSYALTFYQAAVSYYLFDSVQVWNKYIDPQAIYASPTYGLSGITITKSGDNYNTAPTITIAAPTGGGTTAVAYANISPNTGKIYADNLPALSVGDTSFVNTGIINSSGTGLFLVPNNDFLRVGNTIPFNDWTVFINFAPTGHITGVNSVLLSTMNSTNDQSGMIIGISDSNRLFIEYVDDTHPIGGAKRTFMHNYELGANNLISISADSVHNVVNICNHNIAKQSTYAASYYVQGYSPANQMYFGGFTNSGNNPRYTGFFGKMMDFLLLSGASNPAQMQGFAPAFFVTGYIPASQSGIYSYFPIITGANFVYQALSTGVTGYALSTVSIPDKDGVNITVYSNLPVTGSIYGTGVSYITGTTSGVTVVYSGVPEQIFYSNPYIKNYADSNFVMYNYGITNNDILEIYSFSDKWIGMISIIPSSFNLYDFYLSDSFQGNLNIYNDGLLQLTGINYVLGSGKIVSNGLSNYQSTYNFLLYDEISGTTVASGFTGWLGGFSLGNDPTSGGALDIYLNGQKLVSGFDYTMSSTTANFASTQQGNPINWASGYFAFAPARTGNRQVAVVSGISYWNNFNSTLGVLMDEMVYLNGQRLAPGVDYTTVASFSLLNADFRPSSLAFTLYTGDIFDPSILSTTPNITGVTGTDGGIYTGNLPPLY